MGIRQHSLNLGRHLRDASFQFEPEIERVNRAHCFDASTFGMDQKVLWCAEEFGFETTRKSFYRPIQEPALISYWDLLVKQQLSWEQALGLTSLLVGRRVSVRENRIVAHDGNFGSYFEFSSRPSCATLKDIGIVGRQATSLLEKVSKIYYHIIWNHPFDDGNGRFARAVVYGVLAEAGALTCPCLGLNAVFDVYRREVALAVQSVQKDGNIQALEIEIEKIFKLAVLLSTEIQAIEHHS